MSIDQLCHSAKNSIVCRQTPIHKQEFSKKNVCAFVICCVKNKMLILLIFN